MSALPTTSFAPISSTLIAPIDIPRSLPSSQSSAATVAVSALAAQPVASMQSQASTGDSVRAGQLKKELADLQTRQKAIMKELDALAPSGTNLYA